MVRSQAQSLIARSLETFFHLLYHTFAWSYDGVAAIVSLGRWIHWIHAIQPLIIKGRTLELGFGPGHLQSSLLTSGHNSFGIDESAQMCRMAHRRLRKKGLPGNLSRANALALPYPAESFDTLIATFPSPYIFQDDTLREIRRVLKTSGQLVVLLAALPNGKSLGDRMINLLFRITGEAPPPEELFQPIEHRCRIFGLAARHEWLRYKDDRLLVFIAQPAGFE